MVYRRGLLATLLLLSLILIPVLHQTDTRNPQERQPDEQVMDAEQELKIKQQRIADDVAATDRLCRRQCTTDFKQTLKKIRPGSGPDDVRRHLMATQTEHPHMRQLIFVPQGSSLEQGIAEGSLPETKEDAVREELAKALAAAQRGDTYQSPSLELEDGTYFVMGMPHDNQGALVGVIHQRILSQVREHQTRNLRVVPYPADGNYSIESVDSDTLRDVKVDHPEENEGTSHYHKNQIVVKFAEQPTEAMLQQISRDLGGFPVRHLSKLGHTYVFESTKMEAQDMMEYFKQWKVEYAEPHYLYLTNTKIRTPMNPRNVTDDGDSTRGASPDGQGTAGTPEGQEEPTESPNDALFGEYQWNLPIIETLKGWTIEKGSADVPIAVVDTGVDLGHPDLAARLGKGINIIREGSDPQDDVGHGTHVAGIISAMVNNQEGVAGMTWNNPVMPVKVLDASGSGSTYDVAMGIIWAADNGAKVINLSLGNYADAQFLHDAIRYAYDKDVVLVAASGNDNTEQPGYPAAYPEVLAVAATDANRNKASFSNYGDYIDVAAPGVGIASTYPDNQYAALSGTSMASPHVAALAALIRSVNPALTNKEVMDILRQSAEDIGPPGKDIYFGYGQIDVRRALQMADPNRISISYWPNWLKQELGRISSKYAP